MKYLKITFSNGSAIDALIPDSYKGGLESLAARNIIEAKNAITISRIDGESVVLNPEFVQLIELIKD